MHPGVKLDFASDWKELLEFLLQRLGVQYDPNSHAADLGRLLFKNLHRRIAAIPRIVEVSQEFACPVKRQNAFEIIKEKAKKGENLQPYLHRLLNKAEYNDDLLNDWGIHHLHLGVTLE